MRFIQAGLGDFGREWAEYLNKTEDYELAGVADPSPAGRDWAARTLGLPPEKIFVTIEEALRGAEADAVLVVTPPATHLAVATAALNAGKHVLSEKPMVPTLAEARQAIAEANRTGKIYMVSQNYRYRAHARLVRKLVAEGTIGPLISVSIDSQRDMRHDYEATNFRYLMRHPYVIDMSIHHADLIRALTGQNVASVSARSWRVPDSPYQHDPALAALITLDNGATLLYEGSGATYRPWTSWNGDWELVGERGRIVWDGGVDDPDLGRVTLQLWGEEPREIAPSEGELYGWPAVLAAFRHAIETGERPETSVHDNIHSLAIVAALAESIDRAAPVKVADLLVADEGRGTGS